MVLALMIACVSDSDDIRRARPGVPEAPDGQEAGPDTAAVVDSAADTGGADTAEAPEDTDVPEDTQDTEEPAPLQACWLCPARDHAVCSPVVAWSSSWGSDYDYPSSSDSRYPAPARYVDLSTLDPSLEIAPNFVLEEYLAEWKGRYGVMQSHVVEKLQDVRDDVGPVSVNSGFRNPAYNASVGGVTYSRHQYGDAADLDVSGMSADDLADVCAVHGADYVATYETGHTHCDWRDHALDPAFYDPVTAPPPSAPRPVHTAALSRLGDTWTAPATGFDEGEPMRVWRAWDADGALLAEGEGRAFAPPAGTAVLRVEVGYQVTVEERLSR